MPSGAQMSPGSTNIPVDSPSQALSTASLIAVFEGSETREMRFSAFYAHLNKSYAKHVMHEVMQEHFWTIFFDILDKVFKLSLAKFCGIQVMGRIFSKDSIFFVRH
jgi:hypothetical protein